MVERAHFACFLALGYVPPFGLLDFGAFIIFRVGTKAQIWNFGDRFLFFCSPVSRLQGKVCMAGRGHGNLHVYNLV